MKDYLKKLHTAAFSGTAILMDLIASQYGATPCDLAHPYALLKSQLKHIAKNLYEYDTIEKYHTNMLKYLIKKSNKIKSSKDGKNGEKKNKGKSYKKPCLKNRTAESVSPSCLRFKKHGLQERLQGLVAKHPHNYPVGMEYMISYISGLGDSNKSLDFEWIRSEKKWRVNENEEISLNMTASVQLKYVGFGRLQPIIVEFLQSQHPLVFLNNRLKIFRGFFPLLLEIHKYYKTLKSRGRPRKIKTMKQVKLLVNKQINNVTQDHLTEKMPYGQSVKIRRKNYCTGKYYYQEATEWELSEDYRNKLDCEKLCKSIYERFVGRPIYQVVLQIFKVVRDDVYRHFNCRWIMKDGVRTLVQWQDYYPDKQVQRVESVPEDVAHRGTYRILKQAEPPPEEQELTEEDKILIMKFKESLKSKEESFDPFSMGWSDEQIKRFFANL